MPTKKPKAAQAKRRPLEKDTKRIIIFAFCSFLILFGGYEAGRYANLWGEPNELRVIKSEKVMDEQLLGLDLISTHQRGEGSLASKTVSPSAARTFKARGDNAEATKELMIKYAESDGWVHDPTYQDEDSWRAHKSKGRFELTIIVSTSLTHKDAVEIEVF